MTAEVVSAIEDHLARPSTILSMQEQIDDLEDELRNIQRTLSDHTLRTAFIMDHLNLQIPSSASFEGDAPLPKVRGR